MINKFYRNIIFGIFLCSITFLLGQNNPRKKSLFIELFGAGLNYSINIDSRLIRGTQDGSGYRFGFGYLPAADFNLYSIPIEMNYLYGKNRNGIEVNIGISPIYVNFTNEEAKIGFSKYNLLTINKNKYVLAYYGFGYRLQPLKKGIMLKINFLNLFDSDISINYYGLSFGYKLN